MRVIEAEEVAWLEEDSRPERPATEGRHMGCARNRNLLGLGQSGLEGLILKLGGKK